MKVKIIDHSNRLKKIIIAALVGIMGAGPVCAKAIKPTRYRPIETIFESDTITVSGKIKNYDPRSDVKVMELEIKDRALGNTIPTSIPVKPDGSFSRRFFLPMAQKAVFKVNGLLTSFDVYLEPHNNLEVLIDYEKMMKLNDDHKSLAGALTFGGSLGKFNAEINSCPAEVHDISYNISTDITPQEAKQQILDYHAEKAAEIETYIAGKKVSDKAAGILRNSALSTRTADLLNYADYRYSGPTLPEEFYADVLRDAFNADSTIIATENTLMLNRIGFSNVLPSERVEVNVPELRRFLDIIYSRGVELNDKEKKIVAKVADMESADSIQVCVKQHIGEMGQALLEAAMRIGKGQEIRKIPQPRKDVPLFSEKTETDREFIQRLCGSEELPLLWQFAVAEKKGHSDINYRPNELGITNQYLLDRINEAAKPKDGVSKLPDTEGGALMSRLIQPYRGKYLLVDFWGIYCGPCRQDIQENKERRELHRGNPGFAFLFITSENESPVDKYNAYVEKYLKGENLMRLPEEQMILLRELFEFNGIPRYILFNPDGEVMNSNYSTHEFWNLLNEKGIIDESGNN